MKKIVPALVFSFMFVAGFSYGVKAQIAAGRVSFIDEKTQKSSARSLTAFKNIASPSHFVPETTDINSRALKDFQLRFDKIDNVRWFSDKDGFVSYFIQNGHGNRAYYDKKGRWQFSLLLYGEDKLPRDIRASVKSVYFDLAVTTVEEVQGIYGMAYIVHLEDKSNLKVLRVNSLGEMDILLDLVKE
jgi:hypothetical protein